jgi:hypothetical protein
MSKATLEERVAALEREVARLKAALAESTRPRTWQDTVGMFTGDEAMKGLFDPGLELREKDREKARRKFARRDKSKR